MRLFKISDAKIDFFTKRNYKWFIKLNIAQHMAKGIKSLVLPGRHPVRWSPGKEADFLLALSGKSIDPCILRACR